MQDIKTRFLIISDTHAEKGLAVPAVPVDVAIHCGDLTDESKVDEFRTTLGLLRAINAPLKLVIARQPRLHTGHTSVQEEEGAGRSHLLDRAGAHEEGIR